MNKNFSGSMQRSGGAAVEPLAVSPKQACVLANVGLTYLYQLLAAGELDSYWEGRHRKITLESIRRRQQRMIEEAHKVAEAKARAKAAKAAPGASEIG
jgi:excisionase family DNA binding protein